MQSGQFSDVTLKFDSHEYKAHKAVLAYSSEFFSRLLLSEFKESAQSLITLKFPDSQNVFPDLLAFMYGGSITLTLESVIPVLAMADHYLIKDLVSVCTEYLSAHIQKENVLVIVKSALNFHFEDIITKCIAVIAKNFCFITSDYIFFPPSLFLQLLSHPGLVVKNEYALYELVWQYIRAHPDLEPSKIYHMMGTIRYIWMTYPQLILVEENAFVPREFLIEAIMERLGRFEIGATTNPTTNNHSQSHNFSPPNHGLYKVYSGSEDNIRLHPRPPQSWTFECPSTLEISENLPHGVIYHIATRGGLDGWQNPVTSNRIAVLGSSVERGALHDIVTVSPSDLWTKDIPSSWFTIDLGPTRSVVPTAYALRHGMSFKADSLRTWDLQGSTNGESWVLLRRHPNDPALNARYATHIWKIPHTTLPFRFFRILQTGRNSNNRNFLVLCGFELYGELFERG